MKYSSYLCVTYKNNDKGSLASPPPASPAISQHAICTVTYMSMVHAFHIVIVCLKHEKGIFNSTRAFCNAKFVNLF